MTDRQDAINKLNDMVFHILVNRFPQEVWEVSLHSDGMCHLKGQKIVSEYFMNIQGVYKYRGKMSKKCKEFVDKLTLFMKNEFGLDLYKVIRDGENYVVCKYGPLTEDMIETLI